MVLNISHMFYLSWTDSIKLSFQFHLLILILVALVGIDILSEECLVMCGGRKISPWLHYQCCCIFSGPFRTNDSNTFKCWELKSQYEGASDMLTLMNTLDKFEFAISILLILVWLILSDRLSSRFFTKSLFLIHC